MSVRSVTITPEVGDVVELPENVGRVNVDRTGSPKIGYGEFHIGVVGQGDMKAYVLAKTRADEAEMEDGSLVLGIDGATGATWFAIPHSAYSDGGETDV